MFPSNDSIKYRSNKAGFFQQNHSEIHSPDTDSLISFNRLDPNNSLVKEAPAMIRDEGSYELMNFPIEKKKKSTTRSEIYFNPVINASKCSTNASIKNFKSRARRDKSRANRPQVSRFFEWVSCLFCGRVHY